MDPDPDTTSFFSVREDLKKFFFFIFLSYNLPAKVLIVFSLEIKFFAKVL
jgi:hypothetical protein